MMTIREKRLKALYNFKQNKTNGNKLLADYFLATVPYHKLKQVCEDLEIQIK